LESKSKGFGNIDVPEQYLDLLEIIENKIDHTAHDLDHLIRVYQLSLVIAKNESDIDWEVLIPAVFLHDIARKIEDNDSTGLVDHALLGASMAEEILKNLHYESPRIEKIKHCIASHRFRGALPPQTKEAQILYDADKLDVLGAVGIARSFMLVGIHGERIFRDISLEDYKKENVGLNGKIKDLSKHASNLEYELKLKKIPQKLFTPQAKEIARQRLEVMRNFFEILECEIKGLR
jgi:uncharacterized protein